MPKLALGWTRLSAYVLKSPEGKFANYTQYREITGLCDECGDPMDTHPKCEACNVLSGPGHSVYCTRYRGHNICSCCQEIWERLDGYLERAATWNEFLSPDKLKAVILNSKKATERGGKSEATTLYH